MHNFDAGNKMGKVFANQIVKLVRSRRSSELLKSFRTIFTRVHIVGACREDNKRLIKNQTKQPHVSRRVTRFSTDDTVFV